jgi:Tol biopolymer transport system component
VARRNRDNAKKRLTSDRGQELQPQPQPNDEQILYISKVGSIDSVALVDLRDNSKRVLHSEGIASQMRFASKPDGKNFAVSLPVQDRWQLWLMDTKGSPAIQIARDAKYPLMPAWSPDNSFIYFAEPDANERFHIYRTAPTGGTPEDISPLSWNWGEPTTRVLVKTRASGRGNQSTARASDGRGRQRTSGSARHGTSAVRRTKRKRIFLFAGRN